MVNICNGILMWCYYFTVRAGARTDVCKRDRWDI